MPSDGTDGEEYSAEKPHWALSLFVGICVLGYVGYQLLMWLSTQTS